MRRSNVGACDRGMQAFTLIEILVVISMFGVVVALMLPVFTRLRVSGQMVTCASNLHQVGLAFRLYQQDYDDLPSYQVLRTVPIETLLNAYAKDKEMFHCPAVWSKKTQGRYDFNVLPVNGTPVLNANGVMASCTQHLAEIGDGFEFNKGTWIVVRGDASAARIPAGKVQRWVLTGGQWYQEGTQPRPLKPGDWATYRFPDEPWPPQYE